ncbi:MAG TPA: hypothetical protein VK714_01945 [Myxococcota bacterium]|nr:hypothetical protein [Myxococcota bacterium]
MCQAADRAVRRWWLDEALRALHRQGMALRIFQRPTEDVRPFVNAPDRVYKTVFPDGLVVLTPQAESVSWMESVICEALAELER